MSTDDLGGVAPYKKIAQVLRDEINRGALPAGAQMPTQTALARRFAVTRGTIQRALDDLRHEGWIDSQQGRGTYVTDRSRATMNAAGRSLSAHIEAAFQVRHVTLDVHSLTSETLHAALQGPVRRIRARELRPESITVRLLLPSPQAPLALPRLIADPADERPLLRVRMLTRSTALLMETMIKGLRELRLVPEVNLEVRGLSITPVSKLYIVNGTEVLYGLYRVIERPVDINGEDLDIYDGLGLGAPLFHYSARPESGDEQGREFVAEAQRWFDSYWSTIAEPFPLTL
ncbi:GntR family transcriptional regulator [Streptomyces sp. KK5PA1]|uniref:GntR family transcriptional regulator n=1 Tax=Actinacidiphila acididurans TaxID=2784346 RepID=A0ABS2TYQ6_9ACTN|nr:GntR family transcriptional regulator [Actinacidiphila acididurans]